MNPLTAISEPTASLGQAPTIPRNAPKFRTEADVASGQSFATGIDWEAIEAHVARLQRQLAHAVEQHHRPAIRHYKWLLRHSYHAKLLAIRMVTQENAGRKTPGVDGRTYTTPDERDLLLQEVDLQRRPLPVRRVFIPKKNGKLRPLGIPSISDRVAQALHKFAMEPEWDVQFEPNSYGFRPNRSAWDAIEQLFKLLAPRRAPQWVIEGDIKGFFDNVQHHLLLARLAPEDRTYIRRILEAPIMDPRRGKQANTRGTPQGGLISPLLANIALHGMETDLCEVARVQGWTSRRGAGIHVVRYADDFIISCQTQELAEQLIPEVAQWLQIYAGVELSHEKTHITHIADGFDFLGFNLRKYHGKLLIKPAKASKLAFLRKVQELLDANRTVRTETLMHLVNPLLRGWASYYRTVVSKQTFAYCDHRLYQMLWRWAKRRHPRKNAHWIKQKYFTQRGQRQWVFTSGLQDLFRMADVRIIRHVKVQGRRSPYRPTDAAYFERRRHQLLAKRWTVFQQRVAAKTQGRCALCTRPIAEPANPGQSNRESGIRFHLMIPATLGGQATLANMFVTHRWCQQQYHRRYGHHHMPGDPARFLTSGETILDGHVVRAESSPTHH
ncbi:group II intron reverse transcriptase/maturase [Sulfobacillus sp. hq2]|uniref:group II intron reverse transcriptase/maturase n=1 Tax=Sulfobacillus sp. hq2 TaxID=2039167 RepID=UPI000CD1AF88|nr:group II intron reverse transcriptase/maturase [Sulfobacillus sp. hq2]POB11047.1 group II intron reverse transcriptase/maturase [Sulfobacillus sp. hq2]